MKKVLHVGCGRQPMPEFIDGYEEVRLDIDPSCEPDVVASLTDMGDIGPFDAVYGSHVLEHFYPHEVKQVVKECHRVLKDNGILIMVVPNLEDVLPTREPLYESPAGWITGLDMYYGKESFVETNPYMAHKTGFVKETLAQALSSEFKVVKVTAISGYNLIGVAAKPPKGENHVDV